jgi:hypothetical protein
MSTPTRQCGRCRLSFAGDPDLSPADQSAWWLCPPCREALFGTDDPDRDNPTVGKRALTASMRSARSQHPSQHRVTPKLASDGR